VLVLQVLAQCLETRARVVLGMVKRCSIVKSPIAKPSVAPETVRERAAASRIRSGGVDDAARDARAGVARRLRGHVVTGA